MVALFYVRRERHTCSANPEHINESFDIPRYFLEALVASLRVLLGLVVVCAAELLGVSPVDSQKLRVNMIDDGRLFHRPCLEWM